MDSQEYYMDTDPEYIPSDYSPGNDYFSAFLHDEHVIMSGGLFLVGMVKSCC